MLKEFREFAIRGNMVDLAIGVIIGAAFNGLVNSIVNDILMPIIGFFTGGIDFSNMFIQLSGERQAILAAAREAGATIAYGHFITLFINFLIVALVLFFVVKFINKLRSLENATTPSQEQSSVEPAPMPRNEVLLTEIRDLLDKRSNAKALTDKSSQSFATTSKISAKAPKKSGASKTLKSPKKS